MLDAPAAQTEYAIYLFDFPLPRQKGDSKWKRHATLSDENTALREARNLYRSNKYQKIEVKKKFYNPQNNKVMDVTLKVFGQHALKAALRKAAAFFHL